MKLPNFRSRRRNKDSLNSAEAGLKVPKLVTDLFADLRDRRLLPLVILLVVAIVAAPLLLSKTDKSAHVSEVASIPALAEGSATRGSFVVTPASRKLRAYGGRLGYRKARNPFSVGADQSHDADSQHQSKKSAGGDGEKSTSLSATEATPSSPASEGSSDAPVTTEPERVIVRPKVVKATVKAEVGVAAVVKAGFSNSKPKQLELKAQARLPQQSPAIVYTGTSKKGGALFLMTGQVSEFSGDGHCTLGGANCQMIELKPKGSESFRIGYGKTRYTVRLLGYEPIVKEEVVEAEGKKIRFPNKKHGEDGSGGGDGGQNTGSVGGTPSPRWLLR